MLQMISNCYSFSVHTNIKIGDWCGASLATREEYENGNSNYYNIFFNRISRKIVSHCQIRKIYFSTTFIGILILVSYFLNGNFITLHWSNCVLLISVKQRKPYLFYLLRKSKHTNLSWSRRLVNTPALQ